MQDVIILWFLLEEVVRCVVSSFYELSWLINLEGYDWHSGEQWNVSKIGFERLKLFYGLVSLWALSRLRLVLSPFPILTTDDYFQCLLTFSLRHSRKKHPCNSLSDLHYPYRYLRFLYLLISVCLVIEICIFRNKSLKIQRE